jgi:hypothetical protein
MGENSPNLVTLAWTWPNHKLSIFCLTSEKNPLTISTLKKTHKIFSEKLTT